MTGLPLLVLSLVLVASSIAGFVLWSRVDKPGDDRNVRIIELCATIALEASRTDDAMDAKELALIEDAIASRVDTHGDDESASKLLNRLLMEPRDSKKAAKAVEALKQLGPDEGERDWVLQVLSAVIFADNFIEPEEAYFFYKTASRLGIERDVAAARYGIEGMHTEELEIAREEAQPGQKSFYEDGTPIGPDEGPPEGSGL